MDFEDNPQKFKNNINSSKNEKPYFNSQKRDKLKLKLMEKYGISSQHADKIIGEIITERNTDNSKNKYEISHNSAKTPNLRKKDNIYQSDFDGKRMDNGKKTYFKSSNQIQIPEKKFPKNNEMHVDNIKKQHVNLKKQNVDKREDIHSDNNQQLSKKLMETYGGSSQESNRVIENSVKKNNVKNSNNEKIISKNELSTVKQHEKVNKKQNVDDIMESIIPNYNQDVSIEVSNVDLTFEVSNEKVDTLKETFIRIIQRNVSKKIKVHALKNISFKIYKGEKVGIIGYNGAGKSTLLSVIAGIYPPNKGFVKTVGNISPMLSLGAGFDYNYSGRKNIFLNGAVLGYDKEFLESKVDEIIEFSELGDFIDIPIKNYSSGMLAKLGFSIATAVNPDILIIDEVLGVGDVNFNKKSKDKMKSLMDGGTTVLFVSHSIPQVRELCDKAIWIDNGSLRAFDEVNKVCDAYLKDAEKASNEQLANIQFR